MRTLMFISFPVAHFNATVRDGTTGAKIKAILDEQKPESAYFTEFNGQRTGLVVVEIKTPAHIPLFCEPWFLTFNASIQLKPCMTPADLAKSGIEKIGKKYM